MPALFQLSILLMEKIFISICFVLNKHLLMQGFLKQVCIDPCTLDHSTWRCPLAAAAWALAINQYLPPPPPKLQPTSCILCCHCQSTGQTDGHPTVKHRRVPHTIQAVSATIADNCVFAEMLYVRRAVIWKVHLQWVNDRIYFNRQNTLHVDY